MKPENEIRKASISYVYGIVLKRADPFTGVSIVSVITVATHGRVTSLLDSAVDGQCDTIERRFVAVLCEWLCAYAHTAMVKVSSEAASARLFCGFGLPRLRKSGQSEL